MPFSIEMVSNHQTSLLLPLLADAEEGEERIRAVLFDPACTAYVCWRDQEPVGAAIVRWEKDQDSEIIYIAVVAHLRGQGYGKHFMSFLFEELSRRGGKTLLVGTGNSSLENIAFYQKCGFRMFEIRRDYFAYIQPPINEHGIALRDMLVLRYDLIVYDC